MAKEQTVLIGLTDEAPEKFQITVGDKETGIRESFEKGKTNEVTKKKLNGIIATNPTWFEVVEKEVSEEKTVKSTAKSKAKK